LLDELEACHLMDGHHLRAGERPQGDLALEDRILLTAQGGLEAHATVDPRSVEAVEGQAIACVDGGEGMVVLQGQQPVEIHSLDDPGGAGGEDGGQILKKRLEVAGAEVRQDIADAVGAVGLVHEDADLGEVADGEDGPAVAVAGSLDHGLVEVQADHLHVQGRQGTAVVTGAATEIDDAAARRQAGAEEVADRSAEGEDALVVRCEVGVEAHGIGQDSMVWGMRWFLCESFQECGCRIVKPWFVLYT